ncbi:unnamed protein product [Polarella glacialis]|uniref:Glutathione transferase n=1 Tax=Polarella glacialis TaxID=89957 RepID=A0A813LY08_POLGL|nr:unnamed protein product [Polarella glacialis]
MATYGLFTNPICPFAQRATFALALRPLPHNVHWVPLSLQLAWAEKFGVEKVPVGQVFAGISAEELKGGKEHYKGSINATGEVPSLQLPSGEVVMESEIVAEYIDSVATQGTKLMPEDPLLASRVRLAMKRFSDSVASCYQLLMNQDPAKDQEYADAIKAKWTKFADVLDKNGPFCFGSSVTMADVHCAPFLYRPFGGPAKASAGSGGMREDARVPSAPADCIGRYPFGVRAVRKRPEIVGGGLRRPWPL